MTNEVNGWNTVGEAIPTGFAITLNDGVREDGARLREVIDQVRATDGVLALDDSAVGLGLLLADLEEGAIAAVEAVDGVKRVSRLGEKHAS